MRNSDGAPVWAALGLGAIAGSRSMAAPATVARAARKGSLPGIEKTPFGFFRNPWVAALLYALAVGEMVADKQPRIPSRLSPPALLGRVASGSFSSAALFASAGRRGAAGAPLGLLSAVASAFAGHHLRARAGSRLAVPDPVLGYLEDGIVLLLASRLTGKRS